MQTLHSVGSLLKIVAVLIVMSGIVGGLFWPSTQDAYYRTLAYINNTPYSGLDTRTMTITIIAAGIVSGLVLFGFGGICQAQASSAQSAERAARALEALARRQAPRAPQSSPVR